MKPGFFARKHARRAAAGFAVARRLGAVQHDFIHFAAALPYFFFEDALVSSVRAQVCSVETVAAEAPPDRE
ncbi:hypothetical protein [Ensifer aridi]|uniref:hypothetical protein n=1 Tax=Ensifer aridi TaxID=1708715 RepID=UPI001F1AA090|nr:hypothetical protein [Ensifer aridi]